MAGEERVRPPFKDPKPSVERISQLAQRVLTGDILLPRFQRDFVWPREKVLGLWDSIARNYPIGSILLWQSRQELASEREIAGLSIAPERPDYPVNYLLDGQQRISTVCGALYWTPDDDPESIWNIAYDLRAETFMHLHTLTDPSLGLVPLRYISDASSFFRRIAALDEEDLKGKAEALFNRVQDYMIAAVTLGDMPVNDIAPIFERINSTATPLTVVDLMRAATWTPEFDLRDAIDEVRESLADRNFETVDRKTMLRVVAAAGGFGFAADDIDRLRTKTPEELGAILATVKAGTQKAVDFLASHIKAPRPAALPYANQFAVLAELFRQIPSPSADHFSQVERWFWRTTLSGYFGGWNTGQMARDFDAVKVFVSSEPAQGIEVSAAMPTNDVWRVTQFRANSAVSKMLALILSYEDALDLITGMRIDARKSLAWNNDKEFHHFFPREYLKSEGIDQGKANATANIVLLSSASNIRISKSPPSVYLAKLQDDLGRDVLVERCNSLLVSEEALDAALADDYPRFLGCRARTLHSRALELAGETPGDAAGGVVAREDEVLVTDHVDVTEDAT